MTNVVKFAIRRQPRSQPRPGGVANEVGLANQGNLVRHLRQGNADALRAIYQQHSPRLFRFLARLCGRTDVAEDLHQETWIAVARFAPRLADDTDLSAWLFAIARNKHRSWRRFQLVSWRRPPSHPVVLEMASSTDLQTDVQIRFDLERCLQQLPTIHKEVLLLIGAEDLDADQAAAVLGISPVAARQRLVRARAALSARIDAELPVPEIGAPRRARGDVP